MQKHEDGSVTLTKQELSELNKAYRSLYTILSDMPTYIGDFFEDQEDTMNVYKWRALLSGREFRRSDWE